MTPYRPLLALLGFILMSWGSATLAYSDNRVIRCESENYRHNVCRIDGLQEAQLQQRFSQSPCVYGRQWGYTRQGIWVDHGCRAEFRIVVIDNQQRYRHDDYAYEEHQDWPPRQYRRRWVEDNYPPYHRRPGYQPRRQPESRRYGHYPQQPYSGKHNGWGNNGWGNNGWKQPYTTK